METMTVRARPARRKRKAITKNRLILFAAALPMVAFIFAFKYIPLFGWLFAFFKYQPGIPMAQSEFVGFRYFRYMISDWDVVLNVLTNTLALSFFQILASPLSVILAILLNEVTSSRFKKTVQTLTTLPYFISFVIVYSLATILFSSTGLLNQVMMNLGWIETPTNVLANEGAVWWFQTAVSVWKSVGFGAIIYLAAIAGIDQEQYDAAKVDGAGRFQRMWHITVPGVMPTFFVLLLLNIAGILSVGFEQQLVFYNPLVANKIETLDYYVYRMGIGGGEISFGTAVGMAKSVISIALLFFVNELSKRVRGESVF